MGMPDIEKILIREDNYINEMHGKVLPYLKERSEELILSREAGKNLYCLCYTPEKPEAAVVISHGFTETTAKFAEMAYYFLQAGYAVFVYDHCGHGRSYRLTKDPDKVHVDTYKRYVNDLLYVAHTAKKAYPDLPLYLFGHSMGGGTAAAAAAYKPELFDKVVLSSPMIRPQTGNFPWPAARIICALFVHIGKKEDYAPGQHPYSGEDSFEESAALSRARYDYYREIRNADKLLYMNGATYGWLHAGIKMSVYLQKKGRKKITAPVLLFQADYETFVVNKQQNIFIDKLKSKGSAELIHVPESRHEIYRSHDKTLADYLEKIFGFYS